MEELWTFSQLYGRKDEKPLALLRALLRGLRPWEDCLEDE